MKSSSLLRRGLLAAMAVPALALSACGSDPASPGSSASEGDSGGGGSLVIASWGGDFSAATQEELADPFAAKAGVKVQMVEASSQHVAQLEAQNKAGKVTWDVIDSLGEANTAYLAKQGLLERLPADLKAELERVSVPGGVTDHGVLQSTIGTLLACMPEHAKACPETPADFFDTERFPGSRMMYDDPYYGIQFALAADGLTQDQMWPMTDANVERAFAKLEEVVPAVRVWWTSGDQTIQALRDGEVDMGQIWNRPAKELAEQDPSARFSWESVLLSEAYTSVPKGAPNLETAFDYLKFYGTDPEAQARWAGRTGYGVSNAKAADFIAPEDLEFSVLNPDNVATAIRGDGEWWVDNRDELTRRWRTLISGS